MMSIEELIRDYGFSSNVRNEMFIAYDENREGFERVCRKAAEMKNPAGALTSMIRAGQHQKPDAPGSDKPPHDTLEELVAIAVRAFNAKKKKYGFDAPNYAAWVASTWNGRFSHEEIADALCKRLGIEDTRDRTPTPCPPEILERMKRLSGRMGEITPAAAPTLAERLLATLAMVAS